MKKLLLIPLLAIITIGLSGCGETKKPEIRKPIKVLNQESLPGTTPINAAQNVRDLTNSSTNGLENLLKDAQ